MPEHLDPRMKEAAEHLLALHYSPQEVRLALGRANQADDAARKDLPTQLVETLAGRKVPSLRTLQRLASRHQHDSETEGRWEITEGEPADLPFLLGLVKMLVRQSGGRRAGLTKPEAEVARAVRRAAPDLDIDLAWAVVEAYVERRRQGQPTDDLDAVLAFAPWRGGQQLLDYFEAIRDRMVSIRDLLPRWSAAAGPLLFGKDYAALQAGYDGQSQLTVITLKVLEAHIVSRGMNLDYRTPTAFLRSLGSSLADLTRTVPEPK